MLSALLGNGERICLIDFNDKETLQQLRKEERFFCPQCHENVILKLGNKRIFHFSHLKGNQCLYEHERESEYHLNGKIQLFQWLKEQNLNPYMEHYDADIKQRADILFYIGSRKYALEYQCSNINEEIFRKRTNGYLANDYTPIWILGANHFNQKKHSSVTSLSEFHYLFLQKSPKNTWMIPYYCSQTKTFILQHSIQPITNRNVFSNQMIRKRKDLSITQLLSPKGEKKINPALWLKELELWKNKQIRFRGSFQNPFLNEIYQNNLNLFLLPPYLGIPVEDSPFIVTPTLIWQTYLFIDLFLKREMNSPFHINEVYMAFLKRVRKKQIQIRKLPLVKKGFYPQLHPITQYIHLLVNLKILEEINHNLFQLKKDLRLPKSVLDQKEMGVSFFRKYANIIF